jgi:hypothetical protein
MIPSREQIRDELVIVKAIVPESMGYIVALAEAYLAGDLTAPVGMGEEELEVCREANVRLRKRRNELTEALERIWGMLDPPEKQNSMQKNIQYIATSALGQEILDTAVDFYVSRFSELYYGETNKLSDNELWRFCRSEKVMELLKMAFSGWSYPDPIGVASEEVAPRSAPDHISHAGKKVTADTGKCPEPDRATEIVKLLLPMAKGYAYKNNVGSNMQYIQEAEQFLIAKSAIMNEMENK